MSIRRFWPVVGLAWATVAAAVVADEKGAPGLSDPKGRFEISIFAESPAVVNPIGLQVDSQGRVYVISSHTHFRPANYRGPAKDRILRFEDKDGDGRAEPATVFHEGFTHAMDLAIEPEGTLLAAERSAIHRLSDADGDGRAEGSTTLVRLETGGTYPHNGLSGLALDGMGGLYFGLGENLGVAYKLVGSDGGTLAGEAEGGSIYHCRLDGSKLRRVATGVWNPFGMCVDGNGSVFATDNDPDSSPPCRLLHVIEGGDYGFEFRYGRSGLHPFQSWNGEAAWTVPMVTGTGEAPCEIIPYDGGLLVASWADNRLEQYTLRPKGTSYSAEREIVVSGTMGFRPVGLAATKDGTLYVSDWASASYELPGTGRIWRLRPKTRPSTAAPPPCEDLSGVYAANDMSLMNILQAADPFVRAAATHRLGQILSEKPEQRGAFEESLASGVDTDIRCVIAALHRSDWREGRKYAGRFLKSQSGEVRFAALKWIADERLKEFRPQVEQLLSDPELTPEVLTGALAALERLGEGDGRARSREAVLMEKLQDEKGRPRQRALALRMMPADSEELNLPLLRRLVDSSDPELRLAAVQAMRTAPDDRMELLAEIAADERRSAQIRAEAIAGLAGSSDHKELLLRLAVGNEKLRGDALRSLVDVPLTAGDREALAAIKNEPGVARLLGEKPADLPPLDDLAAWRRRAEGTGNAGAGERIFFHAKVGYCARCHRFEGRGNQVGPDLTFIHRSASRDSLLQSIVQPSRDVGPGFRSWNIRMEDGRTLTGISLRKGSGTEDYLGSDGREFSVATDEIESRQEVPTSIMPEGLPHQLTAEELRDLLAFLLRQ